MSTLSPLSSIGLFLLEVGLSFVGIVCYLYFAKPCINPDESTSDRAKEYKLPLILSGIVTGVSLFSMILFHKYLKASHIVGITFLIFICSFIMMYLYVLFIGKQIKQDICSTDLQTSAKQGGVLIGLTGGIYLIIFLIILIFFHKKIVNVAETTIAETANTSSSSSVGNLNELEVAELI